MLTTATIKNIILDRDGTLIEERHYLRNPEEVQLITGVVPPMRELCQAGCRFFVVSNQSGIGRGILTLEEYQAVHARLTQILNTHNITLQDAVFCPHTPSEPCTCRKPGQALWKQLLEKHDLRAEESVMVGDKASDVLFGLNAGMALSVLVRTGHGDVQAEKIELPALHTLVEALPERREDWPHLQARSLTDFLGWLVQQKGLVHAHRI